MTKRRKPGQCRQTAVRLSFLVFSNFRKRMWMREYRNAVNVVTRIFSRRAITRIFSRNLHYHSKLCVYTCDSSFSETQQFSSVSYQNCGKYSLKWEKPNVKLKWFIHGLHPGLSVPALCIPLARSQILLYFMAFSVSSDLCSWYDWLKTWNWWRWL